MEELGRKPVDPSVDDLSGKVASHGDQLSKIDEALNELQKSLEKINLILEEHVRRQNDRWSKIEGGFAGKDFEGHRLYHELIIRREQRKERLQMAVIEKTLSSIVWSTLVAMALAVWHYMLNGPPPKS